MHFIYEDKSLADYWTTHQLKHPLASGVQQSKHAYATKADILNACGKIICVDKQRNNICHEYLLQLNAFASVWTNWNNCAAKLYSWPATFCKVVWQQIWGQVAVWQSARVHECNVTTKHYWHKPSIVFSVQQEVRANDGHTDGDNNQNQKHQQHKAVDVVDLVCPERRKDEIPATHPSHLCLHAHTPTLL